MPGKNDHTTLAAENLKTLAYLCDRVDTFPQWSTTVAMYSALQAIEALFAHDGIDSDQHRDRNDRLKREPRYKHIWKHYRERFNDSLLARYMEDSSGKCVGPLFSAYMPGPQVMSSMFATT